MNIRAPFELVQSSLQYMSAGGALAYVVSLAAYQYTGPHLAYTASKSALVGFVRDAACQVADRGIRVVAISPGPTRTKMFDDIPPDRIKAVAAAAPLRGINEPDDIAGAVAFMVSDAARRITGIVLPVTGGGGLSIQHGTSVTAMTCDVAEFIRAINECVEPVDTQTPEAARAGIESFAGEIYDTALWHRDIVTFARRRIGVIGTGSSGMQAITEIAKQDPDHLYIFLRTPNCSVPANSHPLDSKFQEVYTVLQGCRSIGIFRSSFLGRR